MTKFCVDHDNRPTGLTKGENMVAFLKANGIRGLVGEND